MSRIEEIREKCRDLYYQIKDIYDKTPEDEPPKARINGNYDFVDYLCKSSYRFRLGISKYKLNYAEKRVNKAGCKIKEDARNYTVNYLEKNILPRLQRDNGISSPLVNRETLRCWLSAGQDIGGENTTPPSYAFSPDNHRWIDMLSALQLGFKIFNGNIKKDENARDYIARTDAQVSYKTFLENYKEILGAVDNRKIVPFYARALEDVCASITIYRHKTSAYYEELYSRLQVLVKEQDGPQSSSIGETNEIYDALLERVPLVDESGCEELVYEYVKDNPEMFGLKRYAQVIRTSLNKLIELNALSQNEVSKLYSLETPILKKRYLFKLLTGEKLVTKDKWDYTTDSLIIFGDTMHTKGNEEIVTMLRMMLILATAVRYENADFSRLQTKINANLTECGMKTLDISTGKFCTKESILDYCLGLLWDGFVKVRGSKGVGQIE